MTDPLPIPTPLGELRGRSIALVDLTLDTYPRQARARCQIWRTGATVPAEFVFTGLLGLRVDELDHSELHAPASFAEIPDSPWLARCRELDHGHKVLPAHRHLALRTYDDVIEVLCTGHELVLGEPVPDAPADPDDDDP